MIYNYKNRIKRFFNTEQVPGLAEGQHHQEICERLLMTLTTLETCRGKRRKGKRDELNKNWAELLLKRPSDLTLIYLHLSLLNFPKSPRVVDLQNKVSLLLKVRLRRAGFLE